MCNAQFYLQFRGCLDSALSDEVKVTYFKGGYKGKKQLQVKIRSKLERYRYNRAMNLSGARNHNFASHWADCTPLK